MHELPRMSEDALNRVRALEGYMLDAPQSPLVTRHLLHAGMYARTIVLPAGVVLTGALIKIATVLVVNGRVKVYTGDNVLDLAGYNVVPGHAGRKQVFYAEEDTELTMMFPTTAKTVEEAEEQFTDEAARLMSRTGLNEVLITGD